MDSETVKKNGVGLSLQGLYSYFLQTLFMEKMEIISWIRKPLKKRRGHQPPGFIPICFETLLLRK